DEDGTFAEKCNCEMVDLYKIDETNGDKNLQVMIEKHLHYTNSQKAEEILKNWESAKSKFIKVYPTDYHRIIDLKEKYENAGLKGEALINKVFAKAVKGGRN
ncbi:MAG: hypothetical protein LBL38_02865, partial [Lactobacillales bacterium]|nr:hypothetical protein [Lactobacillales bacterium]